MDRAHLSQLRGPLAVAVPCAGGELPPAGAEPPKGGWRALAPQWMQEELWVHGQREANGEGQLPPPPSSVFIL